MAVRGGPRREATVLDDEVLAGVVLGEPAHGVEGLDAGLEIVRLVVLLVGWDQGVSGAERRGIAADLEEQPRGGGVPPQEGGWRARLVLVRSEDVKKVHSAAAGDVLVDAELDLLRLEVELGLRPAHAVVAALLGLHRQPAELDDHAALGVVEHRLPEHRVASRAHELHGNGEGRSVSPQLACNRTQRLHALAPGSKLRQAGHAGYSRRERGRSGAGGGQGRRNHPTLGASGFLFWPRTEKSPMSTSSICARSMMPVIRFFFTSFTSLRMLMYHFHWTARIRATIPHARVSTRSLRRRIRVQAGPVWHAPQVPRTRLIMSSEEPQRAQSPQDGKQRRRVPQGAGTGRSPEGRVAPGVIFLRNVQPRHLARPSSLPPLRGRKGRPGGLRLWKPSA